MKRKKLIIGILLLMVGIILSINVFAQAPASNPMTIDTTLTNPKFLVAILSGVLMALGFQFVLSNLSVVLGITAIGNISEKTENLFENKRKNYENDKEERRLESNSEKFKGRNSEKKSSTPISTKVMSAAGAWAIITAAISLFCASMLAVKLSLVTNSAIGFTLGLVIWAVFSMIMIYMESKAIGSVISGLWGTTVSAIRGVGSIFTKSETQKAEDIAGAIRKEVYHFMDDTNFNEKLNEALEKVKPKFDSHQFRRELAHLLNDIKIEQSEGVTPREKEVYLRVAEKQPFLSKTDISNLDKIFESVLAGLGLSAVSRKFGGLGRKASSYVKEEYIPRIKDEVEHYLVDHTKPNTSPEIIKAEIDEIFNHGFDVKSIIENKGKVFDKNDVANAVVSKRGVSKEEALDVADQLENALNSVLKESNIKEIVSDKFKEVKDQVSEKITSKKDEYLNNLERRFEALFKRMDRPELDYNLIRKEFEFILHNPSLAPKVIKMKLNQLDSNTLTGLLVASGRYNTTESENIIRKFDEAKLNVIKKIDYAQNLINEKTEEAARFAMEQAENIRKKAVAASWMLFALLTISALASGLGGIAGM